MSSINSNRGHSGVIEQRDDLNEKNDDHLLDVYHLSSKNLNQNYPPVFENKNKNICLKKFQTNGDYNPTQTIRMTRWKSWTLPENYIPTPNTELFFSSTVFEYRPRKDEDQYINIDWYMNFADTNLFGFYYGNLLAQDELQVLECLNLGSIREFLSSPENKIFSAITTHGNQPTPILIGNVDRVINIDTFPDSQKGRPRGLYGREFARANSKAIDLATTILDKPTRVNILAMEAPLKSGHYYDRKTIEFILTTCYTGYRAAKHEAEKISQLLQEEFLGAKNIHPAFEERLEMSYLYESGVLTYDTSSEQKSIKTNIFTGFWGCGAYGGNRYLMVILQLIAAHMAGISSLIFHTVHEKGNTDLFEALYIFDNIIDKIKPLGNFITTEHLINILVEAKFEWGISNGT